MIETLKFALARRFKFRGRSQKEFYKYVVDERANIDPDSAVGGKRDIIGKMQLDFLTSHGLTPDHKLLDYGCGNLRGGAHFIQFLNHRNYIGVDISTRILNHARSIINKEQNLNRKEPQLHLINGGNDLIKHLKNDEKIDIVLAFSVFTHTDSEEIYQILNSIRKIIREDGKFFATFFGSKKIKHSFDFRAYHYPAEELGRIGLKAGFESEIDSEFQHPRDQKLMIFKPISA